MKDEPKKAQTIACHCGKIFAGCMEPYCYTDKQWMKDVRKYALKGYTIGLQPPGFKLEQCTCAD